MHIRAYAVFALFATAAPRSCVELRKNEHLCGKLLIPTGESSSQMFRGAVGPHQGQLCLFVCFVVSVNN